MVINLKSYVFPPTQPDYSASDILRKVKNDLSAREHQKKQGLVTTGYTDVTLTVAGISWAVSDYIEFPYTYSERPIFSWGMEGTYSEGVSITPTYGLDLPDTLADYIASEDYTTYSPAILVPRVIHWCKTVSVYHGCYLLVFQINPDCNESEGKKLRLHFRFEGAGYL